MATMDIRMNDFTSATDGKYIYAENASGNQVKVDMDILKALLLDSLGRLSIVISDLSGPSLLKPEAGLVIGYNSEDVSSYILYFYRRKIGEAAVRVVLSANNIELGPQNSNGTSVINGGDTQICISIS